MEPSTITLYRIPPALDEAPFKSICEYIDQQDRSTYYVQISKMTKSEWIKLGDMVDKAYKNGLIESIDSWIDQLI
jgi:hypothetical protein